MVSLRYLKSYCSDYTQIENYDEAILDEDNIWQCHHKLEAWFTKQELIDMNRYYNVPPRELVLCKNQKEHKSYPHKGTTIMGLKHHGLKFSEEALQKMSPKGRKLSEETKRKMSESHKGKKMPNRKRKKGYHFSEEAKRKLSLIRKGKKRKPCSEETKKKISESNKGKIPWNKGLKLKNKDE